MAQCLVNEQPRTFDFLRETWGQLLGDLDRALGAERRVVTAVRFDGVDQPSFRDPAAAGAPLSRIARIDVDAEDATALVLAAVDAAADSVPSLVSGALDTAAALRADGGGAAPQLVMLLTALQSLVALTNAAAQAARVSLGGRESGPQVARACLPVEMALERLMQQQMDGDADGAAAVIEDALVPAIAAWSDVLAPIRQGVAA